MGLQTDLTRRALVSALDTAALRQRVMARNIANVETPGYRRQVVTFEERLRDALRSRGPELPAPQVTEDLTPGRADGNNVRVDEEMAALSENALRYDALVECLTLRSAQLSTVITEGRR